MGNRAVSQDLIELGNRIRDRRQAISMSQEKVAEQAGISANTVSRIEGGQSAMSIEIFIKMVQILGVDANELLGAGGKAKEGDGQCREMFCRIRHLRQSEQTVVLQTMEALVDGLRQCR
ncbi:XRE family transcriptional regulator [Clostridiaceae bacterium]|nr:XRE family transcriptional regulator [Clostridiaceae bacterium]